MIDVFMYLFKGETSLSQRGFPPFPPSREPIIYYSGIMILIIGARKVQRVHGDQISFSVCDAVAVIRSKSRMTDDFIRLS